MPGSAASSDAHGSFEGEASPAAHERLPEIGAALEAALVRELLAAWKQINLAYFKGSLDAPSIELTRARSRLGLWRREARVIEISRHLVLSRPWGVVVEVLKHEMAHQFVHEVL